MLKQCFQFLAKFQREDLTHSRGLCWGLQKIFLSVPGIASVIIQIEQAAYCDQFNRDQ